MTLISLEPLIAALKKEHVDDCHDNNTCDVNAAFHHECYLWAAKLLTSATECPETEAALADFDPDEETLEEERAKLLAMPHMTCGRCNAILWTEEARATCGNCRTEVVCNLDDIDAFTQAYVECALWSSTDNSRSDGGDPLDHNYDMDDISPECAREMIDDCRQFQYYQRELLAKVYSERYTEEHAGHDFWLTRNGHGAGFWDRGLGEVGEKLSKECKPYGSVDLYVVDEKIHN